MRRFGCFLIIFLACHTLLIAGGSSLIRSVSFRGNRAFSSRELAAAMIRGQGAVLSTSQLLSDLESLGDLYFNAAYYFAEIGIDSLVYDVDSASVDIHIRVAEGDRIPVGALRAGGNRALKIADILEGFETRPGGYLAKDLLEADIERLISRYERMGYPFAKVELENIDISQGGLIVGFFIDEGPFVTIDEVKVAGNRETRASVIIRESRINLHEVFNQDKVGKIPSNLNRMNIFASVQEPELYMTSGRGGLLIKVQEARSNTFDGVVGFAPGKGDGSGGIVTGLVNVSMRNLFGTARRLDVRWLRDERRSQEIGVSYLEPWLLGMPLNIGGGFEQRQQDTIYVRRTYELRADLLANASITIGGIFNGENIIPSGTQGAVSSSRTVTTGLEIRYDTRDDPFSPTAGVLYKSGYLVGSKKIFGLAQGDGHAGDNFTVQKINLDASLYVKTLSRQVLALGIHGRQLTSERPEFGDLYRLGGTNSLRGYLENQFLGTRVAWTNTEYRFLLARRSFFYGFFDNGYYFLPADDSRGIASSQSYKYGYGVGIRLETALGNLGVSLAFGEGDSFSQGKIHFGLINDF